MLLCNKRYPQESASSPTVKPTPHCIYFIPSLRTQQRALPLARMQLLRSAPPLRRSPTLCPPPLPSPPCPARAAVPCLSTCLTAPPQLHPRATSSPSPIPTPPSPCPTPAAAPSPVWPQTSGDRCGSLEGGQRGMRSCHVSLGAKLLCGMAKACGSAGLEVVLVAGA